MVSRSGRFSAPSVAKALFQNGVFGHDCAVATGYRRVHPDKETEMAALLLAPPMAALGLGLLGLIILIVIIVIVVTRVL
jgi:hypothetical protein